MRFVARLARENLVRAAAGIDERGLRELARRDVERDPVRTAVGAFDPDVVWRDLGPHRWGPLVEHDEQTTQAELAPPSGTREMTLYRTAGS